MVEKVVIGEQLFRSLSYELVMYYKVVAQVTIHIFYEDTKPAARLVLLHFDPTFLSEKLVCRMVEIFDFEIDQKHVKLHVVSDSAVIFLGRVECAI